MRASSSQPPIPYWPSIICLLTALIITTSQAVARNQKENMRIACSDQATKQKVIDSLQTVLSRLSTPDDSVTELFNIYDLAVAPEKIEYGKKLAATARRAGRPGVAFDVMRNIANNNQRNEEVLEEIISMAKSYPQSEDRDNTVTFVRILLNSARAKSAATAEERVVHIQELARQLSATPAEKLDDRIVTLHAICLNLSELSEGDLLADYLHRLGKLIEDTPGENNALKNVYYVWASMIYTKVGQHTLAIQACRSLLDAIDALDRRNLEIGRKYRCYDANRYIVYTRLLENHEALDPSEEEQYYEEAMRLARTAPRAAATYATAPLPSIYHHFYHKDYRKAFDLISGCIDSPYLESRRLQMMKMYIGAATATGNRQALLEAYPAYARILEEELDSRQLERYRELQVIYDVHEIKLENLRLKEQEQQARKQMWRTVTIVCAGLLLALGAFIFFLIRLNRRKAVMATRLKVANRQLRKESRELMETRARLEEARDKARRADNLKTDFINNMSHEVKVPLQAMAEYAQMILENTSDEHKKYLATFADRLVLNCELVNTIVNDVLQLAEIHNSTLQLKKKPHSLLPICEAAADAVRHKLRPDVRLSVEAPKGDLIILTDRHRLIQILSNLLSNAAKFTQEGEISLRLDTSADGRQVVISVTDTGCGIDPHNSEVIFDRFTKIDRSVPGAGIGLTIARMLAEMLGGALILDTAYTDGARFILTLPNKA